MGKTIRACYHQSSKRSHSVNQHAPSAKQMKNRRERADLRLSLGEGTVKSHKCSGDPVNTHQTFRNTEKEVKYWHPYDNWAVCNGQPWAQHNTWRPTRPHNTTLQAVSMKQTSRRGKLERFVGHVLKVDTSGDALAGRHLW